MRPASKFEPLRADILQNILDLNFKKKSHYGEFVDEFIFKIYTIHEIINESL